MAEAEELDAVVASDMSAMEEIIAQLVAVRKAQQVAVSEVQQVDDLNMLRMEATLEQETAKLAEARDQLEEETAKVDAARTALDEAEALTAKAVADSVAEERENVVQALTAAHVAAVVGLKEELEAEKERAVAGFKERASEAAEERATAAEQAVVVSQGREQVCEALQRDLEDLKERFHGAEDALCIQQVETRAHQERANDAEQSSLGLGAEVAELHRKLLESESDVAALESELDGVFFRIGTRRIAAVTVQDQLSAFPKVIEKPRA